MGVISFVLSRVRWVALHNFQACIEINVSLPSCKTLAIEAHALLVQHLFPSNHLHLTTS